MLDPRARPTLRPSGLRIRASTVDAGHERIAGLAAALVHAPFAAVLLGRGPAMTLAGVHAPDGFVELFPTDLVGTLVGSYDPRGWQPVVLDEIPRPLAPPGEGVVTARAAMAVPLTHGRDDAVGLLIVMDTRPRRWSSEELEALGELAALAASMVELRARAQTGTGVTSDSRDAAFAEARRLDLALCEHREHARMIHEISMLAIHGGAVASIERAIAHIGAATGWTGGRSHDMEAGAPSELVSDVLRTGAPRWSGRARAFPLMARGRVVGVLEFEAADRGPPSESLLGAMRTLGEMLGQLVDRGRPHRAGPAPGASVVDRRRVTRRPPPTFRPSPTRR